MSSFWKDFMYPSVIDDILRRPDFTLEDILSEDEAAQDARNQNQALVNYLSNPEIVKKLLDYVLNEPHEDCDEKVRTKYPTVASEILMAEITAIDTILYNDKENYLSRLFDFFNSSTVNYFRGGLVGKIVTTLLLSNPKETLEYIKTRENFLNAFTNHINIPSIVDFFLRFITLEEGYAEISKEYLIENNFANVLFNKFSKEYSKLYSDIALFITEIIVATGSDSPLFEQFILKDNIELLFSYILNENNSTALVHGLNVIITLVYILSDDYSMESQIHDLAKLIITKLEKFNEILLPNNSLPNQLGFGRLKIIELYESLLQVNINDIFESQEIKVILDSIVKLFFHFEQHSILHKTFYRIISRILDKPIASLIDEILKNISLQRQIIEYFNSSIEKESNGNSRTSCIAHCIMIGKHILERCESNDTIKNILLNDEEWNNFVDSKLREAIEEDNKPLGEKHPVITIEYFNDDDDEDDYDDEKENDSDSKEEFYDNSSDSDQSEESEEEIDEEDLELKDDEDFSCETDYKDYDISRSEVLITKHNIALYLDY